MIQMRWLLRTAPPIVAVLVPKCPLCLLPIAGVLGISIPSSRVLDAMFAVAIGVSICAMPRLRIAAACCAAVAIAGRLAASPLLVACGAIGMIFFAVRAARRNCSCG